MFLPSLFLIQETRCTTTYSENTAIFATIIRHLNTSSPTTSSATFTEGTPGNLLVGQSGKLFVSPVALSPHNPITL